MIAFQVGDAVLDIGRSVVVVVNREERIVVINMDAIGGGGLQGDGRGDVVLRTHLQAKAPLVDARHDEVDELAGVGILAISAAVQIHVFAIEAAVPDEVLVGRVISRQAELELGRAVQITQVGCKHALALQVVGDEGVARAGRHVDVPKLRGHIHIGQIQHQVVTSVDGVGDACFHAGVEEVVLRVAAEGIVGKLAVLEQAFAPNLGERGLQTKIEVEIADKPVHLVPNAVGVAVGVVVIADDVADLGHVVGVVQIHLAIVAFLTFGILINIVVIIAA